MPSEITNLPRDTTLQGIERAINAIVALMAQGESGVQTWAQGIQLIRQGVGPKHFPTGVSVNVPHTDYGNGNIILQVMGNDIIPDPTGVRQHTLTLMMRDAINVRAFGNRELLWANTGADPLPAGTYHLTLLNGSFNGTTGQDGTYQFTTTQAIPVGGGFRHSTMGIWKSDYSKSQITEGVFITYNANGEVIENNLAATEGSGGTNLGTASRNYADTAAVIGKFNSTMRNGEGSSNYGESALNAWLNSEGEGGAWYSKPTPFSVPPSYTNVAGFLKNIDPAFREALIPVDIVTLRNSFYEYDGIMTGTYTIRRKVFVPSMTEIGLGSNEGTDEGTVFPFWDGATAVDRIKYDISNPETTKEYWLRSIMYGAHSVAAARSIKTTGELSFGSGNRGLGVAPVFTIG